ncbi:MAG: DUF697 domain-containing protein [Thermodesulfobacteriota bacterium]
MRSELGNWWKILRTAVLTAGVLLSFLALVEIAHVFVVLRDAYAPLGYLFLALVLAALGWLVLYIVLVLRRIPSVLVPPEVGDLAAAPPKKVLSYCRYLIAFLRRLSLNPHLSPEDALRAAQSADKLESAVEAQGPHTQLAEQAAASERETIEPLMAKLDEKARREVQKSVRDILFGVTLSPYRSSDLLIVLYRNVHMLLAVIRIYNSRPTLSEQIMILRDVFRVVATVNYLNFTDKLVERLTSGVPFFSQFAGDVAQGIGAGLLTSVAGHGAVYRCRSFRRADREVIRQKVHDHIRVFLKDVTGMFTQDLFPRMKARLSSAFPFLQKDDPRFWDKAASGISSTLQDTDSIPDLIIRKPWETPGRESADAGYAAFNWGMGLLARGAGDIGRGARWMGKGMAVVGRRSGRLLAGGYRAAKEKLAGRDRR